MDYKEYLRISSGLFPERKIGKTTKSKMVESEGLTKRTLPKMSTVQSNNSLRKDAATFLPEAAPAAMAALAQAAPMVGNAIKKAVDSIPGHEAKKTHEKIGGEAEDKEVKDND